MLLNIFDVLCFTTRRTFGHHSIDELYESVSVVHGCIEVLQNQERELVRHLSVGPNSFVNGRRPFLRVSLSENEFDIRIIDISLDQACSKIARDLDDALGNEQLVGFL